MRATDAQERLAAEAWAWRCSDSLPDSAQSARDAWADAETLLLYTAQYGWIHEDTRSWLLAADSSWSMYGANIEDHARAAFRGCPGLRGEP